MDVYLPAPVAVITPGLFDLTDFPALVAWTCCCSRAYSSVSITAKARQRAAILAKQRKASIALLATRAAAARAVEIQSLVSDLSVPGALNLWVTPAVARQPVDTSADSDPDLN